MTYRLTAAAWLVSFFEKPLVKPGETLLRHAQGEVLALNVARADLRGDAAYYVPAYGYYCGGAVASRCVFYGKVGYPVGLYDHALAQILDKQVRILAVALAGPIADDRLG